MPILERILPTGVWDRFSRQFLRATGLCLALNDAEGRTVLRLDEEKTPCRDTGQGAAEPCSLTYRKASQQAAKSGEAMLFRCPHGFLVFAVPIQAGTPDGSPPLVLIGGPALSERPTGDAEAELRRLLGSQPLESVPVVSPRMLLEKAHLAELCLRMVARANRVRESYSQRHSQVMTLFDVCSDLAAAASDHELYALALNILGVLFDVESAAILLRDAHASGYRVHTAMGGLEKNLQGWTLSREALVEVAGRTGEVRLEEPHSLAKLGLPEEVDLLRAYRLDGGDGRDGLLVLLNVALPEQEAQMIRGFATQLSLVMQQQELRRAVEEKSRELLAVQETSRQFLACLEPEKLFDVVLEEARKMTGARKGSLMLAEEDGEELSVQAVCGINGSVVQKLRVRSGQGVAGRVFSTGEPILVHNIEQDARFQRKNRPRYATKSFCSIPVTVDDRVVGVLNLSDKLSGDIFREEDLKLLQAMSTQATIAIERSSYYAQSRELRKISITDPLTGLLNRRYFQERLAEEVDRSVRHDKPVSLMMVDVDHFKLYNDANGHPAGDKALGMLARMLRDSVRIIDVVSRFGGEEFAVILPETRKPEAAEIAERLRAEIEELYFPGEEALPGERLTVSVGIASFPEDARELKGLIQRSDRALYRAKARGRNTVVRYDSEQVPEEPVPASQAWTRLL